MSNEPIASNQANDAPQTSSSFIRLKVSINAPNGIINKMITMQASFSFSADSSRRDVHSLAFIITQSSSTFAEFKSSVCAKFALSSDHSQQPSLDVFWEGSLVEEDENTRMKDIAKDGDMFFAVEKAQPVLAETAAKTNSASMPSSSVFFPSMPFAGFDRQLNDLMSWVNPGSWRPPNSQQPPAPSSTGLVSSDPLNSASGKKICTCRNSKCIKLYCMCFAGGNLCDGCMCKDCLNAPGNEAFIASERSKVLARNPQAFSLKVEQTGDDLTGHKTGCRCRKSRCVKKYCECFDGGFRCNPNCRCLECANMPDQGDGPPLTDSLSALADVAQSTDEEALPSKAAAASCSLVAARGGGGGPAFTFDPSLTTELSCHERLDETNEELNPNLVLPSTNQPSGGGLPLLPPRPSPLPPPPPPSRSTRALMPIVQYPSNVQQPSSNQLNSSSHPFPGYVFPKQEASQANKENSYTDLWRTMNHHQWQGKNTVTTGAPSLAPPPRAYEKRPPPSQAPFFSLPQPQQVLSTQDSDEGSGLLVPILGQMDVGPLPDSFVIPFRDYN